MARVTLTHGRPWPTRCAGDRGRRGHADQRLCDRARGQPGGTAGRPEGFAEAYDANIVSREDNVRAVLAKIEAGEGDARSSTRLTQPRPRGREGRVPSGCERPRRIRLRDPSRCGQRQGSIRRMAPRSGRSGDPRGVRVPPARDVRGFGRAAVALVAAIAITFLTVPVAWLVGRALSGAGWVDEAVFVALRLSLITTAISLALTLAFGTPLAWVLARRRFPGRRIVDALVDIPIVLPPAVAGLALLILLGRRGPFGSAGLEIAFTTAAVVLAQTFVSAPFFIRSARGAFASATAISRKRPASTGAESGRSSEELSSRSRCRCSPAERSWPGLAPWGSSAHDHVCRQRGRRDPDLPLAVYAEFQSSLDSSIAAAAILVAAALAVFHGVRLTGRGPRA